MLRVAVDGGGCSGFQYRFDLVEAAEADDLKVERDGAAARGRRDLAGPAQRLGDRLRRRAGGGRVPGAQPQRQVQLRLRRQLLDLTSAARRRVRIATWNVNSVNARLETVLAWFARPQPDVACLQEIKCVDEKFPGRSLRAPGLQRRRPRPEELQRRRPALEDAAGGRPQGPARRRRRRPRPLHRGGGLRAATRCGWRRSTCPTAIRSAPTSSPTSCAGWSG